MLRIEGRVVDCILTRDGGLISPYVVLNVVQSVEGLRKFRIIQQQDYSVEILASIIPDEAERALKELEEKLPRVLHRLKYKITIVDDIPESIGNKAKLVESLSLRLEASRRGG